MTRFALSPEDTGRYRRDGFIHPLTAMDPGEACANLNRLEQIESARAGRLPPSLSLKPHLLIPWLWDLVHDPRIVGPVTSILGPDVLCWASSFFNKSPGDSKHVAWHQDATYWGLERPDALTAWVAFSPSTMENGCLRVVPGSHNAVLPHEPAHDGNNMLFGGERLAADVNEDDAVAIELEPGEMSLHHLLTVHGSEQNRSSGRRVGFAIRYIAAGIGQKHNGRATATLVAGSDHGHFGLEQKPEGEFHAAALDRHKDILRRWLAVVSTEIRANHALAGASP